MVVVVGDFQFVGGRTVEDEVWIEFMSLPSLPQMVSSYNMKTNRFSCHAVRELTKTYTPPP